MARLTDVIEVLLGKRRETFRRSVRSPSSEGIAVKMLVWSGATTVAGVASVEQTAISVEVPTGPRASIVVEAEPPETIVNCPAGIALLVTFLLGNTWRAWPFAATSKTVSEQAVWIVAAKVMRSPT